MSLWPRSPQNWIKDVVRLCAAEPTNCAPQRDWHHKIKAESNFPVNYDKVKSQTSGSMSSQLLQMHILKVWSTSISVIAAQPDPKCHLQHRETEVDRLCQLSILQRYCLLLLSMSCLLKVSVVLHFLRSDHEMHFMSTMQCQETRVTVLTNSKKLHFVQKSVFSVWTCFKCNCLCWTHNLQ